MSAPVEHQHFVRFEIRDEGQVRAEFHCTATEDAECRRWCGTCIDEERERCQCDELDREPELRNFPCNYLQWMDSAPDESFGGAKRYIPGPDLVPVVFTWEGDYYTWDFANTASMATVTTYDGNWNELSREQKHATMTVINHPKG